jgi:diamine N-acetyltransferase
MTNNILTGNNLKLRALEPSDVDVLYAWENDTSIWKVSNTLTPFSRFQLEEYVLNAQNDIFSAKQLRLMVDLLEAGKGEQSVGTIDLFDYDPFHCRAGVGILIREPHRNKGHAVEAMNLLITYAFSTLGLHQLFCNISQDNNSSVNLFEKLGFKKCGIKKEWIHEDHTWKDEWMFQLINSGD